MTYAPGGSEAAAGAGCGSPTAGPTSTASTIGTATCTWPTATGAAEAPGGSRGEALPVASGGASLQRSHSRSSA
eukprot:CAMPEP_0174748942 /NCGR_PEP_ID=MMETSP1094-20130205/94609_1 /TAXON_ID=156173 /ORGANISM="Chrysochromulina brevifilum, Strain UTEX LB 985" /LENGTH=73 /DNA_ID=CAMNT_0015954065 /DNA_START=72 /DNA_END=288 /DNA_ORIENTATION=-